MWGSWAEWREEKLKLGGIVREKNTFLKKQRKNNLVWLMTPKRKGCFLPFVAIVNYIVQYFYLLCGGRHVHAIEYMWSLENSLGAVVLPPLMWDPGIDSGLPT